MIEINRSKIPASFHSESNVTNVYEKMNMRNLQKLPSRYQFSAQFNAQSKFLPISCYQLPKRNLRPYLEKIKLEIHIAKSQAEQWKIHNNKKKNITRICVHFLIFYSTFTFYLINNTL